MNSTILQVPINKSIRDQAAIAAEKMGFSSLQEVVRLFLNRVAIGQIDIVFEPVVKLSDKNDKRYSKIIKEIESGKAKIKTFDNVGDLMKDLSE